MRVSPDKHWWRALAICSIILSGSFAASAQDAAYTNADVDFAFELPSGMWRETTGASAAASRQVTEFVYGDRLDGYLRIRKEIVDAGTTASNLATRDQDQTLRYRSGYVAGKQEPFAGKLSGTVASYEFTNSGKPMSGRVYYLQADNRTIYTLHFTGLRDKLSRIRNQTDNIARTFRRK